MLIRFIINLSFKYVFQLLVFIKWCDLWNREEAVQSQNHKQNQRQINNFHQQLNKYIHPVESTNMSHKICCFSIQLDNIRNNRIDLSLWSRYKKTILNTNLKRSELKQKNISNNLKNYMLSLNTTLKRRSIKSGKPTLYYNIRNKIFLNYE